MNTPPILLGDFLIEWDNMQRKKQKPSFLKEEKRANYIKKIISLFLDERDEKIGIIAAGKVLDFFIEDIGRDIYKQGIKDTRKLLKEKIEDLEVELDLISEE